MPAARPVTPLDVPEDAPGLLLFGGMFDPPHVAHVEIPARARDDVMPGAWLVYVPAARSPHKPGGPVAPDQHRLAMLRLATAAVPRCTIWTDEIDRARSDAQKPNTKPDTEPNTDPNTEPNTDPNIEPNMEPSYWITTLERARSVAPPCELRFLIGSDQAAAFHRWKNARRILDLAEPLVMLRAPHRSAPDVIAAMRDEAPGFWSADELEAWRTRIYQRLRVRAASTDVRKHTHGSDDMIAPQVKAYIEEHGLYR